MQHTTRTFGFGLTWDEGQLVILVEGDDALAYVPKRHWSDAAFARYMSFTPPSGIEPEA